MKVKPQLRFCSLASFLQMIDDQFLVVLNQLAIVVDEDFSMVAKLKVQLLGHLYAGTAAASDPISPLSLKPRGAAVVAQETSSSTYRKTN